MTDAGEKRLADPENRAGTADRDQDDRNELEAQRHRLGKMANERFGMLCQFVQVAIDVGPPSERTTCAVPQTSASIVARGGATRRLRHEKERQWGWPEISSFRLLGCTRCDACALGGTGRGFKTAGSHSCWCLASARTSSAISHAARRGAAPLVATDLNGRQLSLETYRGKPVLLHFWGA